MKRVLGYRISYNKGTHGQIIKVDPEEAVIIRHIFDLGTSSLTIKAIADKLVDERVKNKHGVVHWTGAMVNFIMRNEKYTGDYLIGKTYTVDHLTHKVRTNKGEATQYLIEDHHEAIVSRELYNAVKKRFKRKNKQNDYRKSYPFTARFICGECGHRFQRTNERGKRARWNCGNRLHSEKLCRAENFWEEDLKQLLIHGLELHYDGSSTGAFAESSVEAESFALRLLNIIRTIQNDDSVEIKRAELKRTIADSQSDEQKKTLEKQLASLEDYWSKMEREREWRDKAIIWLKDAVDTMMSKEKILSIMPTDVLVAFVLEATIGVKEVEIHWSDNSTSNVNKNWNKE